METVLLPGATIGLGAFERRLHFSWAAVSRARTSATPGTLYSRTGQSSCYKRKNVMIILEIKIKSKKLQIVRVKIGIEFGVKLINLKRLNKAK